jgi:hypothetical protein
MYAGCRVVPDVLNECPEFLIQLHQQAPPTPINLGPPVPLGTVAIVGFFFFFFLNACNDFYFFIMT